ncbi:hypothetical protein [Vibrio vulnificus]|uniref:hypothetical protein n=1 Tax=Vibrio vulnificus TaxID=672 RepID=UPI00324204C9
MKQDSDLSNPELAEKYTITLFAKLYERWPTSIPVTAEDITEVDFDMESLFFPDAPDIPNEWYVYKDLLNWLEREGYIFGDRSGGDMFTWRECQLTQKAIEAMKNLPDPLNSEPKRTLADGILEAAKDITKKSAHDLIKLGMTSLYQQISG